MENGRVFVDLAQRLTRPLRLTPAEGCSLLLGIRTLRDPYSNKPFVQFYTTKRVGGDVTNFEAMKILAFEA